MTPTRSSRTGLAAVACASLLLPACEMRDCVPTKTDARDAAIVDAGDVPSSGVLEARLTSRGKPLAGKTILFHLRRRVGGMEFAGSVETGSDGVARVDLKEDLVDFADDAVAESYKAQFDGDSRYCSSRDEANLDLVGTP